MNRRSAMAVAGGLVAAMLAGAVAFSATLDGGGSTIAASTAAPTPIVRTIHHTVTIHKKAKAHAGGGRRVVVVPAPSSGTVQTPSASSAVSPSHPKGADDREGAGDD